ncbi:reverse transcriptase domain-containing protein [Streptomyces sp. IBSBF 2390]|uniref:reverse transcriptase domain-containing protein n=1 Tax=Streptomyces sp. IBSBF 2390 TaxID=2903533 RepID=UPI002FDC5248
MESSLPAGLLQTLLIRAGVEQNPGPTIWLCSVCGTRINKNIISVQCNRCQEWCHQKRCSGLANHRQWSPNFIAPCCNRRAQTPIHTTATTTAQIRTTHTPPTSPAITVPQTRRSPSINTAPRQARRSLLPSTDAPPLVILQLNCNGVRDKIQEIIHYMEQNNISIAAIQETKLSLNSRLNVPDYTLVRKDRGERRGGGVMFIIKNNIQYRQVALSPPADNNTTIEQLAITITSGSTEIMLINIYIPPSTCCPNNFKANLEHLLQYQHAIIMGDINAHNDLWDPAITPDARGEDLAEQITGSDYGILNDLTPTRVTPTCSSSPDITLASPSLLTSTDWSTASALSSDHIPIIISLQRSVTKTKTDRHTFVNFKKADWNGYRTYLENKFEALRPPQTVFEGEKVFRTLLKKAAGIFIPAGVIPEIRPNFPTAAAHLADQRDELRARDPANPRIQTLSKEIKTLVNDHIRNKWRAHLKESSFSPNTKNLWTTIKRLNNGQGMNSNSTINFDGTPAANNNKAAKWFNKLFTPHPGSADKAKRKTLRKFHNTKPEAPPIFTTSEVEQAIKSTSSSKAFGPDGLAPILLKNIGPNCIEYLTGIFNLSLSTLKIPNVWKVGRIIPLLKPNKSPSEGTSYRPISLLSPLVKLMEKLLLPLLASHLTPPRHQHGFRKAHSTTTALHTIYEHIQRGLNDNRPNKRTVMVALDLSKAFDTVDHVLLLNDIFNTSLPTTLKRWLCSYLHGRHTYVEFRDSKSRQRKVKQGVPQGGVLSPLLFNFYMREQPTPPQDVTIVTYADDCTLLSSHKDPSVASDRLNNYLPSLHSWLQSRNLVLSPEKSTATLFTTWTKEVHDTLDISVNGSAIPTVQHPKILGVVFDNMLTFNEHAKYTNARLRARTNVLKALAGSSWGKEKEILTTTYKATGRTLVDYAAPIFSPQLSTTSWMSLQRSQNSALRTITGCLLMTHQDHLHQETMMLPVKEHNMLLSKQYLLGAHFPDHPCHDLVIAEDPPRHIRRSIKSAFPIDIEHLVPNGILDERGRKTGLKTLHTEIVESTINSYTPNRVLNQHPPAIDHSEEELPRSTRVTLSRLRSGFSTMLNSYNSRLNSSILDICPKCGIGPHDTNHLFACSSNPTTLQVDSLWKRPKEAARFLELNMDIDDEC